MPWNFQPIGGFESPVDEYALKINDLFESLSPKTDTIIECFFTLSEGLVRLKVVKVIWLSFEDAIVRAGLYSSINNLLHF